jgi:hypothetical protein
MLSQAVRDHFGTNLGLVHGSVSAATGLELSIACLIESNYDPIRSSIPLSFSSFVPRSEKPDQFAALA